MSPETITLGDGRTVHIRSSRIGDAPRVHAYIKALGESTEFILSHPGDVPTLERIEKNISSIESGGFYSLCAIDPKSEAIVANTSLSFSKRVKLDHAAGLGTGVLPGWQGIGLGSWMLDRAIADMKANPKIHRLELTVMEGNDHAQRMYERAGFVVEGRKNRSIRQPDGSYADEILMGMWLGA